jgi:hypothetical protein
MEISLALVVLGDVFCKLSEGNSLCHGGSIIKSFENSSIQLN